MSSVILIQQTKIWLEVAGHAARRPYWVILSTSSIINHQSSSNMCKFLSTPVTYAQCGDTTDWYQTICPNHGVHCVHTLNFFVFYFRWLASTAIAPCTWTMILMHVRRSASQSMPIYHWLKLSSSCVTRFPVNRQSKGQPVSLPGYCQRGNNCRFNRRLQWPRCTWKNHIHLSIIKVVKEV